MRIFHNQSVGIKITLAPAVAIICLLVLSTVAWMANDELNQNITTLTSETIVQKEKLAQVKLNLVTLSRLVNQSLAWEGAGFKAEQIALLDADILQRTKDMAAEIKAMQSIAYLDQMEKQSLAELATEYQHFSKAASDVIDLKSGGLATASSYMSKLDASFARLNQIFNIMSKRQIEDVALVVARAESVATKNQQTIIGVLIVAALICGSCTVLAIRLIVRPLQRAVRVAQQMARGDFSQIATTPIQNDATGRVLQAMLDVAEQMSNAIRNIRGSASEVGSSSMAIADGNGDLSIRTKNSSKALHETASALHTLSEQITESSGFAAQANQLAREATTVADEGGKVVLETISVMEQINLQAKMISEIIAVIDGIAFQTNILALNAAVEAARAGEQGRGFAVVATEVRTLAHRSAVAAKEIRELIVASVSQTDIGAAKVKVAGETMQRVVSAISKLGRRVDDILRTSKKQSEGVLHVENAIAELDKHTRENADLVELAAHATQSLQTQAQHLLETVNVLKARP